MVAVVVVERRRRQEGGGEGRKGGRKDSERERCDENMSERAREGACPGE